MASYYILVDGETQPASLSEWMASGIRQDRRIARTQIGDADVSTVFLGLNHNWGPGAPLLFETMVFGGEHDQEMERYSTLEEARLGHERMVALVGGRTEERA